MGAIPLNLRKCYMTKANSNENNLAHAVIFYASVMGIVLWCFMTFNTTPICKYTETERQYNHAMQSERDVLSFFLNPLLAAIAKSQ
jgi:hypothetical protein